MRILLVQTSFLGDTILSTPVIAGLRKLYPNAEIWTLTTAASERLLSRDPLLSGRLVFDKRKSESGALGLLRKAAEIRKMGFGRAYVLHRSFRSGFLTMLSGIPQRIGFEEAKFPYAFSRRIKRDALKHDVLRNLSILSAEVSIDSIDQDLRLFAPALEEISGEAAGFISSGKKYAVLVPGSAWRTKMWNWSGYRAVAQGLLARGFRVAILGSDQEVLNNWNVSQGLGVADFTGRTSIEEILSFIKHAAVVVCNDSMSLHVASAFKVPTAAMFCATVPAFGFGPWNNKALVLEAQQLKCRPCSRHGTQQCPEKTDACMTAIGAEEVLQAIDGQLL